MESLTSRRALLGSALSAVAVAGRGAPGQAEPYLSVRHFGAAGDGAADDGPAINAAIKAASSRGGGTVFLPAGRYRVGETIIIPESFDSAGKIAGVDLVGDGVASTVLTPTRDFGAGRFLLSCGDPMATAENGKGRYGGRVYDGVCRDLSLWGLGTRRLGAAPCAMSGLAWGSHRALQRVGIESFNRGIDIVGDHAVWDNVTIRLCYYGIYYPRPSRFNFGDLLWTRIAVDGSVFAAIGVAPDSAMLSVTVLSGFFGQAPYAIFKEAGAGNISILNACYFLKCLFEGLGNGWIWDDNAPYAAQVLETSFAHCQVSWADAQRVGGRPRTAALCCHATPGMRIETVESPWSFLPGDEALFDVAFPAGRWDLDWSRLMRNCEAKGKPLFTRRWTPGGFGLELANISGEATPWHGKLCRAAGAVAAGDALEYADAQIVRRSTGEARSIPAGIAMMNAADGPVPVANRAEAVSIASTLRPTRYVRNGPGGSIREAAPGDPGIIGAIVGGDGSRATLSLGLMVPP